MSGFGDGKPFGPWIEEHIRRKAALDHPADSLVQSLEGARISLAGGVTTVADCCYAGTVADAALATGLRAIVYLEGFSDWGRPRRANGRCPGCPADRRAGHRRALSPRTVYRHARRLRRHDRPGPRARPADRNPHAGVGARDPAPGRVRAPAGTRHGADPWRVHDPGRHRAGRRAGRARDSLPTLERASGLRDGADPRAAGRGCPGGAGYRLARLGDGVRHVGGDARRGDDGPRPRRAGRRTDGGSGPSDGNAGRSRGHRAGRRDRIADAGQGGRCDRARPQRDVRSSPGTIPKPPLSLAGRRIESCSHLLEGRYAIDARPTCRSLERPPQSGQR